MKEAAKEVIRRCKSDEEFLQAVLDNTDEALKIYNLSEAELKFFRDADRKAIEGLKDSCFELAG